MTPQEYELFEDQFRFWQISEHTWMIDTASKEVPISCSCYLLEGSQYSVMIDAGMSKYDLKRYLSAAGLIQKPCLGVINTHAHFDHTGGNGFWGRAFMHPNAIERATKPFASCDPHDYSFDYEIKPIKEGDQLELGNRCLFIYEIPAHDPTSIAILDPSERLLFSGDELEVGWLGAKIPAHLQNMLRLKSLSDKFDKICTGHHGGPLSKESIDDFIVCDNKILSGDMGDTYIPRQAASGAPRPPQMRVMRYKSAHMMYMQNELEDN